MCGLRDVGLIEMKGVVVIGDVKTIEALGTGSLWDVMFYLEKLFCVRNTNVCHH